VRTGVYAKGYYVTTALKNFGWGALRDTPFRLMSSLLDTVYVGSSGHGTGQFSLPYDVSFSPDGRRLAVADMGNNRIQVFGIVRNAVTHQVSYGTVGSGNGQFMDPSSVYFSPDGARLAVVDTGNNRIQILGINGNVITHQVSYGTYGSGNGQFIDPYGVAFSPNGLRLVVTDVSNNRIQLLGISGNTITHQVSYGTYGSANGQFSSPFCAAFSSGGSRLAVADVSNSRIQFFGVSGNTITFQVSYGAAGSGSGQFTYPYSVAFNNNSTRLCVADLGNSRIQIFGVNGNAITRQMTYGTQGGGYGQLIDPIAVAFSADGTRLAIADAGANRVQLL